MSIEKPKKKPEETAPIKWMRPDKEREEQAAKAEAERASGDAQNIRIVIDYGVKENGVEREATPEEKAEFESWGK